MNLRPLTYLLLPLCLSSPLYAAEQHVVPVGQGSIASAPPENKGVSTLFARAPRVEPESTERPLPTNDWWTDLLWSQPFPGKMWAVPLTIDANAEGLRIWYPKGWTENGQELHPGAPLIVRGIDTNPGPVTHEVLFDFEGDDPLKGWQRDGKAFMRKPDRFNGTSGAIGKQIVSSFTNGDAGQGVIISPTFTIDRPYLHLLVAGGDDKEKLGVKLLIDDKVVAQALGKKSNHLAWNSFDVSAWTGKEARLQVVDHSQGGWGFTALDQVVLSDKNETPSGGVFSHASTVRWGDWTVTMRLNAGPGKYLDVTFGRGLPTVWVECSEGMEVAFDLPVNSNEHAAIIHKDNRAFAAFIAKTASFDGGGVRFGGGQRYVSVSALPSENDLSLFAPFAHAIPRDTRFSWKYSPKHGKVVSTWEIETEVMQGTESRVLQGWIPHHYRRTQHDLKFIEPEYASRRGRLRLAPGNTFHIVRNFNGMVPALPVPESDFNTERLTAHLDHYAEDLLKKPAKQRHGGDTYWGGKSMLKNVNTSMLARLADHPRAEELEQAATDIVTDWLTYTPGEKERYYARYSAPWKGLIGFNPSYGSEQYTDNHFHYGYLVYAAAMVAARDPAWKAGYAELATEVARQYANWDRDRTDYPYLRTFEPWVGHSYAGGLSSHSDGNNQESSSEAMQSWAGLFLLGSVLGNDAMRDCGAMGYAIEGEAVQEYWNDTYGWNDPAAANYPESYAPTIASVVRDRDIGAWTWFSGRQLHIYGIQWLPNWTTMHYLGRHPKHAAWQFEQMMIREGKGTRLPYEKLDNDWGHVALGYLAWSRPDEACRVLEDAYASNWPLSDHRNAGHSYYLAHAHRDLGTVDWSMHSDLPTSLVFTKDGKPIVVAWNPSTDARPVTVYAGARVVGTFTAAAQGLTRHAITK